METRVQPQAEINAHESPTRYDNNDISVTMHRTPNFQVNEFPPPYLLFVSIVECACVCVTCIAFFFCRSNE